MALQQERQQGSVALDTRISALEEDLPYDIGTKIINSSRLLSIELKKAENLEEAEKSKEKSKKITDEIFRLVTSIQNNISILRSVIREHSKFGEGKLVSLKQQYLALENSYIEYGRHIKSITENIIKPDIEDDGLVQGNIADANE